MALGTEEASPLEMAAAYTVFANGGVRLEPSFISNVVGNNGRTIYQNASHPVQVVSPETAYIVTDMLTDVVNQGTARSAKGALGGNAFAGKTGTANDGWFIGYTPNLVCAVWIGFDENKDLKLTGADTALPVWVDFMRQSVEARPEFGGRNFPAPAMVAMVTIDPETGMLAGADCPHREIVVTMKNALPGGECFLHQRHDSLQPETYQMPLETQVAINETESMPTVQNEIVPRQIEVSKVSSAVSRDQASQQSRARLKIVEITKSQTEEANDF